jgi:accessory gene regulator B
MRDLIINLLISNIKKQKKFNESKLAEIKYGLEVIYLTITKTIVIFLFAFILNIAKELLLIFLFYGLLRLFGFGLHASKSWFCWLFSLLLFLGLAYFSDKIKIDTVLQLLIPIICIISIIIYAPADTEKRPILSKKRRILFKVLSSITALSFFVTIILIKNNLYINILIFSLIIETFMILPISYKVFRLRYNNYKYYKIS